MAKKPQTLNERVEDALDVVNTAQEAMNNASVQGEEIASAVKNLSKAAAKLRAVLEDVSELFDDIESALGSVESELENLQDLKLSEQVDALESAGETIEELTQLDLSTEGS